MNLTDEKEEGERTGDHDLLIGEKVEHVLIQPQLRLLTLVYQLNRLQQLHARLIGESAFARVRTEGAVGTEPIAPKRCVTAAHQPITTPGTELLVPLCTSHKLLVAKTYL